MSSSAEAAAGGSATAMGRSESDAAAEPTNAESQTDRGPLLDWEEADAWKEVERLWELEKWAAKCQAGLSHQNMLWRSGVRFTKLSLDIDTDSVRVTMPIGLDALPPSPNHCEEAVQNGIAILTTDPFRPDVEPSGDSASERDQAQFATWFLESVTSESALNTDQVMEGLLDIAATHSSGFAYVCYDPSAGGMHPLTIKARPSATSVDTAETGDLGNDVGPWVVKYVAEDGKTLLEKATGAKMAFRPGLGIELLNANQVRFVPRRCGGIGDALGVVICAPFPLGRLRSKFPEIGALSPEEQWKLVAWKPTDYKRLLPVDFKWEENDRKPGKGGENTPPSDETLVFTYLAYFKSHPTYPRGCVALFGDKKRISAKEWVAELPDGGQEMLDLPLAQFRWRIDAQGGNPYGVSPVRFIGPVDEMIATQVASALEYLWRFSRPRLLLPMGDLNQPEDYGDPDKPLLYNPAGKPEFMNLPDYPQMGLQLSDMLRQTIRDTMGVQGPAIGQPAGSVRSAQQQNTIIEQSNVALTGYRSNLADAYERLHRLILQAARAWFDVPLLMTYRGPNGAFQAEEMTRADLTTAKHVRVRRGSGTMLAPTAKNELIMLEVQNGSITPQEAARLRRDNVSALVGIQDSPHVLRTRRQLQAWRKGPPETAAQAEPQPQMGPDGQPMIDPMTGQPVMADPMLLAAQQTLKRLPVDDEQLVAQQQHEELARAVSEMEFYAHFPPGWQQGLVEAYLACRQAAGIVTVMEQQQQMAAQQQAQAQQAESERGEAKEEKAEDRKFQMDKTAMQNDAARERQAQQMAARSAGMP